MGNFFSRSLTYDPFLFWWLNFNLHQSGHLPLIWFHWEVTQKFSGPFCLLGLRKRLSYCPHLSKLAMSTENLHVSIFFLHSWFLRDNKEKSHKKLHIKNQLINPNLHFLILFIIPKSPTLTDGKPIARKRKRTKLIPRLLLLLDATPEPIPIKVVNAYQTVREVTREV